MSDQPSKPTDSPSCCSKQRFQMISHFISAILIPVLLAVLTVILTFQQESIAKTNRDVDLHIAGQQHQQNLDLAVDEQRNTILAAYMNDVSSLLLANNFSLNQRVLNSIVYPKTLSALRQLDAPRKSHMLHFLRDSRLFAVDSPVFLSLRYADLNAVPIARQQMSVNMRHANFSGAYLENATFYSGTFTYGDFTHSHMRGAICHSSFNYATFHNADVADADFSSSAVYKADFTSTMMRGAKMTATQISTMGSISDAVLPNGTRGRNANLLHERDCETLRGRHRLEQNVTTREPREWQALVRRTWKLKYFFDGWFETFNGLSINFTEYDANRTVVTEYSCVNDEFSEANGTNRRCLLLQAKPREGNFDGYTYIAGKTFMHDHTHMIAMQINFERKQNCRALHFSFETA